MSDSPDPGAAPAPDAPQADQGSVRELTPPGTTPTDAETVRSIRQPRPGEAATRATSSDPAHAPDTPDHELPTAVRPPNPRTDTRPLPAGTGDEDMTIGVPGMAICMPQPDEETLSSQGLYSRGDEISRGGMGRVSLAWDHNLQRQVALKEMLSVHRSNPDAAERFLREAYVTGELEHPGIVPVHHFGTGADGLPFYTMKFISGETLESAIRELADLRGPEAEHRRTQLLQRVLLACQAVAFAHTRGVIHRDIKPSNIMLGEFGETMVLDWGVAKRMDDEDLGPSPCAGVPPAAATGHATTRAPTRTRGASSGAHRRQPVSGTTTRAGDVMGTPAYMPPEQARGELNKLGPASDVFSLGATLYCLVTGQSPYGALPAEQLLDAAAEARFKRPRRLVRSIPPALETIILRAMAREPEDRYATACELAADLERYLTGELVQAHTYTLWERLGHRVRRHRLALVTTLLVGIATTAVALFLSGATLMGALGRTMVWIADAQVERSLALLEEWYDPAASALGIAESVARRHGTNKQVAEAELESVTRSIPNVEKLYYAVNDGVGLPKAFGSSPETEIPEGLDVRERPWYAGAIAAQGGLAVTAPYEDITSGELCVSVSRLIQPPGADAPEIVVAADLNLAPLMEFLEPKRFPEGGIVLVTSIDPTVQPPARWTTAEPVLVVSTVPKRVFSPDAPDASQFLLRALVRGSTDPGRIAIGVEDRARGETRGRRLFADRGRARAAGDWSPTVEQATFLTLGQKQHMAFTAKVDQLPWEVSVIVPMETLLMPFKRAGGVFFRITGWGLLLVVAGAVLYFATRRRRPGRDDYSPSTGPSGGYPT